MAIQLAGKPCVICNEVILTKKEGTWCARCLAVLCVECASEDPECPTCGKPWDDPARHFVYSERCPGCLEPVDREEFCPACGEETRWNNQAEFDAWIAAARAAAQ